MFNTEFQLFSNQGCNQPKFDFVWTKFYVTVYML